MQAFAVIMCGNAYENSIPHKTIFDNIKYLLKSLFIAKRITVERIGDNSAEQSGNGWNIYIPIDLDAEKSCRKTNKQFERYIKQILSWCSEKAVNQLYIGQKVKQLLQTNNVFYTKNINWIEDGKMLYKCLIKDIIKLICIRNNLQFENADVCIINQSKNNNILYLLTLLAPSIKYITVVTYPTPAFMIELQKIYEEFGNTIIVTSDIKSGVEDCDLIINTDNLESFKTRNVFTPDKVLINFSDVNIKDYIYIKSEVVNCVEICFERAVNFNKAYIYKLMNEFNSLTSAEILLRSNIFIGEANATAYNAAFNDSGMEIVGLIGRNGVI